MQCNSKASDAGGTGWNGRIRNSADALHNVHLGSIGDMEIGFSLGNMGNLGSSGLQE